MRVGETYLDGSVNNTYGNWPSVQKWDTGFQGWIYWGGSGGSVGCAPPVALARGGAGGCYFS